MTVRAFSRRVSSFIWLGRLLQRFTRDSRMDEETLREKARPVIQNGKLPTRTPARARGGPGVGAPCAICELPVRSTEMEFEIQFAHDGGTAQAGLDKYHVHIRCFAAWEFERQSA